MSAMIGLDINLYLDVEGRLVITDKPAPGLTPLAQSRGFRLNAPLDDVVTADVEIIVGGVDLALPLEQARFIVADEEVDADMVLAMKRDIEARRAEGKAVALMERKDAEPNEGKTVYLNVNPRWWARPWVCWLLWRLIGHLPSWAIRVRRAEPPGK
mgnify:CR=1 FL=1